MPLAEDRPATDRMPTPVCDTCGTEMPQGRVSKTCHACLVAILVNAVLDDINPPRQYGERP